MTIDLSGLDRILEVNAEDLDARVEAGVTRKALNEQLRATGLFFPIDPGADASLGGMAATRASGTNAVRYGTMRENVLGLTVVTADGSIVRTGGRARKSAAGYDLTRLFVGSEGTLGIITEVQLRLHGIPEAISAAVCPFADLAGAVDMRDRHHPVGRAGRPRRAARRAADAGDQRLLEARLSRDPDAVLRVPRHPRLGRGAGADGRPTSPRASAAAPFQWATRPEERNRLWAARHDVFWSQKALRPGAEAKATDVCVPISRLAEAILAAREDADRRRPRRADRRPRRRRQFPHDLPRRPERSGRVRPRRRRQRPHGRARARHGRHLHRRARHRLGQDAPPRGRSTGRPSS